MLPNDLSETRNHLRVLVAEDSHAYQVLAIRLLQKKGFSVTVVSNGREAVRAQRQREYDVILMDIDMPEMDGLTATRHIRAHEHATGTHVPIVAVTSNNNRDDCIDAGMDHYLAKPLRVECLSEALDVVLGPTAA